DSRNLKDFVENLTDFKIVDWLFKLDIKAIF
ncbi:MAG: hypothetical protein PWQ47_550, partial [Methanothermococcus sp.]|nr:hypothetical protein [Methanothermococcus sp.]